jgi:alkanesulfonate monooxygenase SsuD/methylene tetrahydromethanopterin reductase-like flavin-dependent oxidoreductase (luciferase family)
MEMAVQTMSSYATSLELALWAEQKGLAAFAVADHYVSSPTQAYALDQLTVLAAVAARTDSIELASLVSPITFRHPAVMHKMGVTLDEISGGRFNLGVGTGWQEAEHERFGLDFPPTRERFDRLEEALAYLVAARSGSGGHDGSYYRLAADPAPEPPGESLGLIVGGSGTRRTPRLAGTYADEFNVFPAETPVGERVETARRAAETAGRDPEALRISMAFPLVVAANPEELTARIEAVSKARGGDPERIRTRWPELGIPVGTADQYRDRLAQLEEEGVERVYLQIAFDSLDEVTQAVGLLLD